MVTLYRVQANLQDKSLLPRDRYVNTWYVANNGEFSGTIDLEAACTAIEGFYNHMANFLSPNIDGGHGTISAYDVSAPLESPPAFTTFLNIGAPAPAQKPLPQELACCLSFHADPQVGVNRQSWRGRIYLGPLNARALNDPSVVQDSRPAFDLTNAMTTAALMMASDLNDANCRHYIASKTQHTAYPVANYSVDDAWDIQRSRGDRPTEVHMVEVPGGGGSGFPFTFPSGG